MGRKKNVAFDAHAKNDDDKKVCFAGRKEAGVQCSAVESGEHSIGETNRERDKAWSNGIRCEDSASMNECLNDCQ